MERDAFLQKTRRAITTADLPTHPDIDPGGWVPPLVDVDLVTHFTEKLESVAGIVHTDSPDRVIDSLIDLYVVESFTSWDIDQIAGLDALPSRIPLVDPAVPAGVSGRLELNSSLHDVRLGITGAEAGFAETGTVVLRSGPGRSRIASVVPLVHVAVLARNTIHRSASHWASTEGDSIGEVANVIFITGPSKTGDIESIITHGIHGPKHLHIILV